MSKVFIILSFIFLANCTVNYTQNGGDAGDAKTISVMYIANNSALGPSNLGQLVTEKIQDIFLSQTKLTLVRNDADINIEGYISRYVITPLNIQSNDQAAQNRLTMAVNIEYFDRLDPDKDKQFNVQRFADYDSDTDISSIENQLIDDINDQIAQDIFNKTLGDW